LTSAIPNAWSMPHDALPRERSASQSSPQCARSCRAPNFLTKRKTESSNHALELFKQA
jgi:hypothetical protein